MAKPIADSVAAMVKIKITNNCPKTSSKYIENTIKFRLTDKSINSIDIIIIKIFFRFNTNPKAPIANNVVFTNKKYIKLVIM